MKMKRSIAPLLTEAALILLIVGVAVVSVILTYRPDGPAAPSAWDKEKLSLTQKADALEQKNRTLRDTVRVLEARIAQQEGSTGTRADLLTEIEELRKRRDRARASTQTAAAEVDETRKALAALEEQLGREKTKLETMRAAASRTEADLAKVRDSLRKKRESLAEKETEAAKRAEAAAADVIRIKQTLSTLETTLGERQAALTALSKQAAKTRKTLTALNNQIEQRKAHLKTTNEAASQKDTAMAKARDSLRKELESLTQQENAAAKRTAAARAELVRVNQALAVLETTLGERRTELATMSEDVARQRNAATEAARTLKSEIEVLNIQRDLAERHVESGKSRAERLRQEFAALQKKLRAKQAQLKSVEDAVRRRRAALDALPAAPTTQTPAQLTDKTVCLEAWARVAAEPKARARLARLRNQIAAAETELCELNKRHKAAKEKLGSSANTPSRPPKQQ